jgi:hypothetical protein
MVFYRSTMKSPFLHEQIWWHNNIPSKAQELCENIIVPYIARKQYK